MTNFFGNNAGAYSSTGHSARAAASYSMPRTFLPEITVEQLEDIQRELRNMVGPRVVLMNDNLVQIRRAINVLLEEPENYLVQTLQQSKLVALLSSDPEAGIVSLPALRKGGATHLAMNLPKVLQGALDAFQKSRNPQDLDYFLKVRGFKHPLAFLDKAAELGLKLVAVGDQSMDQADKQAASILSVAMDTSQIVDSDRFAKVILWASSPYVKRSQVEKACTSAVDYLRLNHKNMHAIHCGNYLVDGGPLRKIVFDMATPGIVRCGQNRLIDSLPTGIDIDDSGQRTDVYGRWNAIFLMAKPPGDFAYFLAQE
jgi:hypothetical protein